jgi:hypothetical protein
MKGQSPANLAPVGRLVSAVPLHFTFNSLTRLLSQHGFKVIKHKDYHSDFVKAKLKRIPIVSLFARLIAKMYSGTSVAVIAKPINI